MKRDAPTQLDRLLKAATYSLAERRPLPAHKSCCRGVHKVT
ncbi:hypothetical protein [Lysobacter gummosus]